MFNPAAFSAPVRRESIVIGNSEHPVNELVVSLLAKPVPGCDDLWYVRTKKDTVTITYRPADKTMCFYEFGFAEFRKHVENKTLPNLDVIDIDPTSKYLGNEINRELRMYYGF